jgi:hypothetical protein
LVGLCFELVNFHEVLIPLDRLNFTMAMEVINVHIFKLRQMLENSLDEGTDKVMAKVMYMMKQLISLGSSQSCVGDSPFFFSLLLEMMSGLPSLPPWLPEAQRQKFEKEVMSISVMHSLLTMAAGLLPLPLDLHDGIGHLVLLGQVWHISAVLGPPHSSLLHFAEAQADQLLNPHPLHQYPHGEASQLPQATWQSCKAKPALSSAKAVSCLLLAIRTDKDKLAVVVRDTWRKLVEGSYKPANRLISSRQMMVLSKLTLAVVETFCTQDLVSLVENMKTVVMTGQYRQYLLVCLLKVVMVVAW